MAKNTKKTAKARSNTVDTEVSVVMTRRGIAPLATRIMKSLRVETKEIVTRDDTYKLMEFILSCNKAQLREIIKNPITPVSILTFAKGIQEDMDNGRIAVVKAMWEMLHGKSAQKIEVTTQEGVGIPDRFMSRQDYVEHLRTLTGDSSAESNILQDVDFEDVIDTDTDYE